MIRKSLLLSVLAVAALAIRPLSAEGQAGITPAEVRAIAKEAYIYGYPMVDSYRILYASAVDRNNPGFKAPWNELANTPRVYTPEDRVVQTPNSDTPYSNASLDLRAEPMVLTVPAIEKRRYFSVQLIDLYTFNFAYIGSRTTGNDGGSFLVAGPGWKGAKPQGIKGVIRSETELVLAVYRTQLLNAADLDNVKKIQDRYKVQPLSQFLGKPAPPPAPTISFPKPLTAEQEVNSPEFFSILNFVLQFCPANPSEKALFGRFAKLDIGAGKSFDVAKFSPEQRKALSEGMADAWRAFDELKKAELDTGRVTSGDIFGTRAHLKNNYLYRMAAAKLGIYGNSKEEAMYPMYAIDAAGQPLDGSKHRYTVRFPKGQLPPVNAFWSLTMYELPTSLLVANPLNRYLINSPMLPELKRDPDGGLTLYLQHDSPGQDKESNWLPAPNGPFMAAMRLYWPNDAALKGTWKQPPLQAGR